MGCGICCLKCLLILFNTLFGIIGLVLLGAGAFVLAAANKVLQPFIDGALKSLPGLPAGFALKNAQQVNVGSNITLDIGAILKPVAIFLIIFGLILVICAIFGSCGACCSNKIMLIIYAVIIFIILLIQVIVVSLFFSHGLDGNIKKQMKKTITNDYVGLDDYSLWSIGWNVMMLKFECCGVDSYLDFASAKKWKKDRTMSILGASVPVTLTTPMACCKMNGAFPSLTPIDNQCATLRLNDNTNNWKIGCFKPLMAEVSKFNDKVVGAVAGILVFQFLCAIAAIIIAVFMQKEKDGVV